MKPKIFVLILLTFSIFHFTSSIAEVRYVSKTGSSTPPYTSWETAADSIQKAVDIADVGDTIYVANGIYYEAVYVDKTINLWGSSMDSTVIDGTNISGFDIVYFFENNSSFKYFTLKSSNPQRNGIVTRRSNLVAVYCRINSLESPLNIRSSSVHISNFIINAFDYGITDECFPDTCHSVYTNNVIISTGNTGNTPVWFGFGGYPVFTNNIYIQENSNRSFGIYSETSGTVIKNNLIAGFNFSGIRLAPLQNSVKDTIENNILAEMNGQGIESSNGSKTIVVNNIFLRNNIGVFAYSSPPLVDYNLFWEVQDLVANQPFIGDSNIIADPMFVKDTIPSSEMNFDFHLQQYSPAIDKGNPNILDKDGTRSDIGMYGGPFGEIYTYQDLAPLAPRNLSAVVDTNQILLKWNKNTEADTSYYKVYRDTVINFTIDSTKLVSSPADTIFKQLPPYKSSKLIYKITCVDNQGNESKPSEEVVVDLTSVSIDELPLTINDNLLYQNYPNPFNPSTIIGYKLKDRAYVKLMVYDIKGELVSVLVNKEQSAGYYEVEFNAEVGNRQSAVGNDLASGIYLYRIEVIGDGKIPVYTEMKKMMMIK